MRSFIPRSTLSRALAGIVTAFLGAIHGAAAAPAADAQAQARALLVPASRASLAPVARENSLVSRATVNGDAQARARALLLGKPIDGSSDTLHSDTIASRSRPRRTGDAQALARQIILAKGED